MADADLVKMSAELKFDVKDVLSVAMARAERFLKEEINRLKKLIKENKGRIDKTRDELVTSCETSATPFTAPLETINEQLTEGYGFSNGLINTTFSINEHLKQFVVTVQLGSYYNSERQEKTFDFDDEQDRISETLSDLHTESTSLHEQAMTNMQKLSDIDSIERQYKARIVEMQLSKSDEGQDILDALTVDIEKQVLCLPA